jgi:hypothetical protein
MIDQEAMENYNPYCPVCSACGEEGCCSAMACEQDPNGDYCKGYLQDLKFGYMMNRWVQKNILDEKLISEELIEKYNQEWDKVYEAIYKK